MLNNKADAIEEYILRMLAEQQDGQVELKRTDLADAAGCAPSQISYVLSTRFTNARGFKVESRRGLGGYIRIAILQGEDTKKKLLYEALLEAINVETTFEEVKGALDLLVKRRIITVREAELAAQTLMQIYRLEEAEYLLPEVRINLLQTVFSTLAKIS